MAVQTIRTDDLTGDADAVEVIIVVNGEGVAIDLSAKSVGKLTQLLAPYFAAGTSSKYDVERKGFSKRKVGARPDPKAVREWAAANGISVPAMGRVPAAVVEQYLRS